MGKKKKRSQKSHADRTSRIPNESAQKLAEETTLFNSTRNADDSVIFHRYTSNDKYQKRFCEIYDHYYKFEPFKKVIDGINSDLIKYADGFVPDYMGYHLFLFDKYLKSYGDRFRSFPGYVFADPNGKVSEKELASMTAQGGTMFLPLIYAHKTKCLHEHPENRNPTKEDVKEYNSWKLLTSILSKQLGFCLDIWMNGIDSENVKHLDDEIDSLNNRALVQRFFEAVKRRKKSVCFKIIGRARDLDPGETDYLEAVAHYYDSNYDDSIRYCLKVREDYADYGQATALLLESYAAQGDIINIIECISKNKKLKFQTLQLIYLLQETTLNLPEEPDAKWMRKTEDDFNNIKTDDEIGTEYYDRIIKNTSECILNLYTYYFNQSYYPSICSTVPEDRQQMDDRTLLALVLVSELFEKAGIKNLMNKLSEGLTKYSIEDVWLQELRDIACSVINKIAIDYNPVQSRSMVVYALDCQYRLGLVGDFVNNINRNIDVLSLYYKESEDEKIANIILSAYTEESLKGDLNSKVKEFVDSNLKGDMSTVSLQVGRKLSKNASIALESAEELYSLSKTIDWGWKDAGMISLAYFRIIEVELNQKMMMPLVDLIGIEQIRGSYDSVKSAITGENKKTYTAKWGRLVSTLERIQSGTADVDGLMLGEIEYFFKNIGSGLSEGDTLAAEFRNKMSNLLTPDTDIDDFIRFIENDVIKKEIRDKYRNPPAHTKYLPYKTACACRDFFYHIMSLFDTALKE